MPIQSRPELTLRTAQPFSEAMTQLIYLTRRVGAESIPFVYFTIASYLSAKERMQLGFDLKRQYNADGWGTNYL
jgi:hypothetical protein